jgi:multiple sugar transport system permease protein
VTTLAPAPRLRRAPLYLFLALAGLVAMTPFVWMILSSFKTGAEVRAIPPTFLPEQWTLDNYATILGDRSLPLGRFYLNSAIVALANVATTLFTSSLLGYLLAKAEFRGRRVLFGWVLVSLMIPFQVTMIPGYLILAKLGLLNKLSGLIIPSFINAFGIFLMRQFSLTVPQDLLDAARVDGASEWTIYSRVVVPQLGPALATLGMLTFMFNWNAYLWPLIVLTEEAKRTLPIILFWYSTQHSNQLNLVMAASVIVVLPVLVVFLASQRWIVRGITLTGAK